MANFGRGGFLSVSYATTKHAVLFAPIQKQENLGEAEVRAQKLLFDPKAFLPFELDVTHEFELHAYLKSHTNASLHKSYEGLLSGSPVCFGGSGID